MAHRITPRNPRKARRLEVVAARRVGVGKACACGESNPQALIPDSEPPICAKCDREKNKRRTFDDHHPFGKANSPVTISIPVNDHRGRLTVAQYDWPAKTLKNEDGSPLLTAAAMIRGFADIFLYLIDKFLMWIVDMLEHLDTILRKLLGEKYWIKTKLKAFEPEY